MYRLFNKHTDEEHNFWMSFTDLMAGFLAVFIVISVVLYYQFNVKTKEAEEAAARAQIAEEQYKKALEQNERIQEALDYIKAHDLKNQIQKYRGVFVYDDKIKVFIDTVHGSIVLTHRQNKDLFRPGKQYMQEDLRKYIDRIGNSIVTKSIEIWRENDYKDMELRIEGHTDPKWGGYERGSEGSYRENLWLSSERANYVYNYILNNCNLSKEQKAFVMKNMISVGYSFSTRIRDNKVGDVNLDDASRRIEFRIISK